MNVNCFPDTWDRDMRIAQETTGVIRYHEPLEDFELLPNGCIRKRR